MRIATFITPVLLLLVQPVGAQTLRLAADAAWERQPAARALAARQDEFAARRDAADSFLAAPPAATLSNRNDQLNRQTGQSEWEAGIALPLWLPGYQSRTLALIESEQEAHAALVEQARWKLAGEVREAWWQSQLAANEREVAARRVDAAQQLAADVDRRVRAGDLPRMDANQARATEAAAEAGLAETEARAHRAQRGFLALTGLAAMPAASGMTEEVQKANPEKLHPAIAPLEKAIAAARSRLQIATRNVRELPELTLGMRRERAMDNAQWDNSTLIAIRIPLATDVRNRPKIAAANADLIEAETLLPYEQSRLEAERDATARELERARESRQRAESRQQLAAEMRREYNHAFKLGNIDLPQRLRIESEAFDAELAAARARIEAARAISRYNQAIGVLP
jgi:cobalt-zinc-cadmium efflux system outer membrane protein